MIPRPPAHSALLKNLSALARGSLWLLLGAWLMFLLAWGTLHWVIVPRIGEFRPMLEAQATRLLGIELRIGAITAQSNGLVPSFALSEVQLLDPQGRQVLQLSRVLVALSPRSVWNRGFDQLVVERPQLQVRRDRDGKFHVAGLDLSSADASGQVLLDWFFSQREWVFQGGSIDWTDDLRGAPTLSLRHVQLVLRNVGRRHDLRLDATPPAVWGERFSVSGRFLQPLLSLQGGRWQTWDGQFYSTFERVELSELGRYVALGVDLQRGSGTVRAWADVVQGQWQGGVADLALSQVQVGLGVGLQPLALRAVQGRLTGRPLAGGLALAAQALSFDTQDGLHWPASDIDFQHQAAQGTMAARGEFTANQLDLAVLAQIANRLPLNAELRAALLAHAPKGLVRPLQLNWQGELGDLRSYSAKGQVTQLELASASLPGVQGASIVFDVNQAGGKASVAMENGALELPGLWSESRLPLSQLSTDVRWQLEGDRLAVQLPNLKFSNTDAQGEAQIKWETGEPGLAPGRSRWPGVLDLQATLSRVDGTRVHRYLPLSLSLSVRDYLREAITAGTASAVKVRVKGNLEQFPFLDAKQGQFQISADVRNASYRYVPRALQSPQALPWPALMQLNGELLIDRNQLQLRGVRAQVAGTPGLQILRVDALLSDLGKLGVVTVSAKMQGPLTQALAMVNASPLGPMTGRALARTTATGDADYQFKLTLPLANLARSTVQGSVLLAGNDIQISPDTPPISRARGSVNFSESGFTIAAAQARLFGGEARLEGGTVALAAAGEGPAQGRLAATTVIRVNGVASAEGLRQAPELGLLARLARQASGSTAYTVVLSLRQGPPDLLVTSTLQGLSLSLPAPLAKSAETLLPLRFESLQLAGTGAAARPRDQLTLTLGRLVAVDYVRDLAGTEPRVLHGSIGVGLSAQEAAPMPDAGVLANINVPVLDIDAWSATLSQWAGSPLAAGGGDSGSAALSPTVSAYLPTSLAVRAADLTVAGRRFSHIVLGGSRDGLLWRANLDAGELNGYLEYRQPTGNGAGRVYARLARLVIVPGGGTDVEALLSEQPVSIPALDVVVEELTLRGKRLGRLEVDAVNRGGGAAAVDGVGREWRLNKLNLIMPEATFSTTGSWSSVTGAPAARGGSERRRTLMNFRLDMTDVGLLLGRLGMKDVVRRGRGKMEGQVSWLGSPISIDYPSLGGAFLVDVEAGQFLKADPGIAKLLGVLSLQTLPRRLVLDFRDVFSEGFSFDNLRGDVAIEQGIARSNNLQMKGVNAAVMMEGRADLALETQAIRAVVVPELNAGTASLIATVINPAVGLGTFLAQLFLRRPLMEAATQAFQIDGSWADPIVRRVDRKSALPDTSPPPPPEVSK
jgi:uncharacterized protein (TIGR02099 family)